MRVAAVKYADFHVDLVCDAAKAYQRLKSFGSRIDYFVTDTFGNICYVSFHDSIGVYLAFRNIWDNFVVLTANFPRSGKSGSLQEYNSYSRILLGHGVA